MAGIRNVKTIVRLYCEKEVIRKTNIRITTSKLEKIMMKKKSSQ